MVRTQNIRHSYEQGLDIQFPDLDIAKGEALLILGESGAGKTTLLHVLGGLLKPTEGKVNINSTSIYDQSNAHLDRFRGDHIGMVFQQAHFIPAIKAVENIELAMKIGSGKIDNDFIQDLFDRLNISHRKDAYPSQLSQGERQRLAIARACVNKPHLILADELTSALDDTNCAAVISLLKDQSAALGNSLIIVTHDQRLKDHFENSITLKSWRS